MHVLRHGHNDHQQVNNPKEMIHSHQNSVKNNLKEVS